MSQFIETICIKDGLVRNLSVHQSRVDRTFNALAVSEKPIDLFVLVGHLVIPGTGWYKLRVTYDLAGNHDAELIAYQMKSISKFGLIDIQGKTYEYKYANRDWINEALEQSGLDEIIMHDVGLIKDTSYANLVFYDGIGWYTPMTPLLEGTQRAKLVQEGIIQPKSLYLKDLSNCTKFKCINAMMEWGDAIEYDISMIDKSFFY